MLHLCGNVRYKIILHQQRSMVMILYVMQREIIVLLTRMHHQLRSDSFQYHNIFALLYL